MRINHRASRTAGHVCLLGAAILFSSCATNDGVGGGVGASPGAPNPNDPRVQQRAAQIAAEPRGDYYVGRRWWTEGTRFWGYLRRPGEPWSQASLVVMNESVKRNPDRLPERPGEGPAHGFDHNYEYRVTGRFTGKKVYDPNSNLELPEFQAQSFELVSATPGFLFQPGERYNSKRLPPKFPPIPR